MAGYLVLYSKEMMRPEQVTVEGLVDTHVAVMMLRARNMEMVFHKLQAENWSPNGDAKVLIKALRLNHTSMMVGDVVMRLSDATFWVVAPIGYTQIFALEGV